jgi:hypothetical protein
MPNSIHSLIRQGTVTGVSLSNDDSSSSSTYDSCKYAKNTHKPIKKECTAPQANHFGVEIHSDVWGPSPVQSMGGHKYYVTFTDDYLHCTHVKLLCTKDKAFTAYKAFAAWASTQYSTKIKCFRSDHSSKFTSHNFNAFLKEQGMEH